MTDSIQERVRHIRLMTESAKRRSSIYSGISSFNDKKTADSLGALNRASAPGRKIQKLGFIMLWIPEPTGVTCAVGAPMILDGRYLDRKYNGSTLKDIGEHTKETITSINSFKNHT